MARKIDVSGFDEKAAIEMMGGAAVALSRPATQIAASPLVAAPAGDSTPVQEIVIKTPPAEVVEVADDDGQKRVAEKRKKQYDEIFLVEKRVKIRAVLSVEMDTSRKLERVMRMVFENSIPMSSFVDNILNHHLDKYADYFKQRLASKSQELY
jgi:hypothetical protein